MARTRTLLDWLTLALGSGQPLYRQIYEQIRHAVVSGRVGAGTNVPASRALAASLGISRITVLQAYDQLIAEGFLESHRGSGTQVASLFGDEAERRELIAASVYGTRIDHTAPPTIQELPNVEPFVGLAFRPEIPAFDLFPRLVWSRLLRRHGQRNDPSVLDYAHIGGYRPSWAIWSRRAVYPAPRSRSWSPARPGPRSRLFVASYWRRATRSWSRTRDTKLRGIALNTAACGLLPCRSTPKGFACGRLPNARRAPAWPT